MKFKIRLHILLFFLGGYIYGQQETVFTNFLVYQYLYNPAYAGVVQGTQFNMGYRNQWVGFEGAPKTYMFSGYGTLKKKPKMTLGGTVTSERIGLLQRTSFYGTYSYNLKINKKANISFGLGVGGVQHNVKIYDARPYDHDDSFMSSQIVNGFAFDANAGFYFYTKNFFLGFSDQHMPNSKILWSNSIGRLTQQFYAYTGYNFYLDPKKEWVLQPSILARTNSPAPYQLEFTLKTIYREMIWLGFTYRQKSAACFMLGCNINKQFTFAYSYDYTLTNVSKYSSGSHELLIGFYIPYKKKKSKSELIKDADEEELNKIDNTLKTNLRNKKKKDTGAEKKTDSKPESETEKPKNDGVDKPAETQPEKSQETTNETVKDPEPGTEVKKEDGTEKASDIVPEKVKEPETGTEIKKESVTEPEKPKEAEPKK